MVLVESLYFLSHSMVIPTNLPDGGVRDSQEEMVSS